MNGSNTFFDFFFFLVLVICTALAFVDFLIGEEGRRRMRDVCASWWLYLQENTFAGIMAKKAASITQSITSLLGDNLLKKSLSVLMICFLTVIPITIGLKSVLGTSTTIGTIVMPALLTSFVCSLASLLITIYLLQRMSFSDSWTLTGGIIIIDMVAIVVLFWLALVGGIALLPVFDPKLLDAGGKLPGMGYTGALKVLEKIAILAPAIILSLLWSISHLSAAATILVSKILQPLLQPLVSIILYRFQASQKGVLTMLAIGGGAFLKLSQEAIKLLPL